MNHRFSLNKIHQKELEQLDGWHHVKKAIAKIFPFSSFNDAIEFVNAVALLAEKHHHHPEITIDYNKVSLSLTTKDSGGLTEKDFALAKEIDTLLKN
ncbi:MAG: 4a-hydroxytetrahydrobiopterin dehydratase [Candidatus Arcticimaribacter sp.]